MASAAQIAPDWPRSFAWLRDFFRDELKPYPGRGALIARMVLAATIVMLVNMTFRIPYGAYAALYALNISRENPDATLRAVRIILVSYFFAVVDVLVGAIFFSGNPSLRLIWVIGTLFAIFYALRTMANYTAAARFGYLVAVTIPVWDEHIPARLKVENTLWAVAAISMASILTAVIEVIFARIKPWDDLVVSIAERLKWVESLLRDFSIGRSDKECEQRIIRLSILGTSRLRRDLQRSDYSPQFSERMGAVVALVGRLVDLASNFIYMSAQISNEDRDRLRRLADSIANIRDGLLNKNIPPPVDFPADADSPGSLPLLREMEITASLATEALTGARPIQAPSLPSPPAEPSSRIFAPDAFSNPDHIRFALKGGTAASLCYLTYNLIAWPGISTAVTTCILTALTTIGGSRQKQILRFSGALVGGVIIGIGAQVFILPAFDSIADFLLLFEAISLLAAWFITAGPRLSYFGVQLAIAFYLINLQEFRFQTSLSVARDRVAGVMLGLFAMWLIFDQLWGTSAATEMKRSFIATLRLLAQFVREPLSPDARVALERSASLRSTIQGNVDKLQQYADGVMLEFGPARERNLAMRSRLLQWQLQLRMIFITRVALMKYRLRLPGFELPAPIQAAQKSFDTSLAIDLESMASRLEGTAQQPAQERTAASFDQLNRAINDCCPPEPSTLLAAQLLTFLPLCRRIEELTVSLNQEVRANSL